MYIYLYRPDTFKLRLKQFKYMQHISDKYVTKTKQPNQLIFH